MRQPTKPLPDHGDRSAFGSLEHTDQLRALGGGWGLLATARTSPSPNRRAALSRV
jgi:hypothetical protein